MNTTGKKACNFPDLFFIYFYKVLDNIANAVVIFEHDILSVNFAHVMAECGKRTFQLSEVSIK